MPTLNNSSFKISSDGSLPLITKDAAPKSGSVPRSLENAMQKVSFLPRYISGRSRFLSKYLMPWINPPPSAISSGLFLKRIPKKSIAQTLLLFM